MVGKPNDCIVPNTEFISDREKNNFCEDFSFKTKIDSSNFKTKKNISKKLFDDDDDDDDKDFDSLFKK